MTCRAPILPKTPASLGLGLLSLPFFRDRKPSTLPLFLSFMLTASAGNVAVWSERFDQLPLSSKTIDTPPPLLTCRRAAWGLYGGRGRLNDIFVGDVWLELLCSSGTSEFLCGALKAVMLGDIGGVLSLEDATVEVADPWPVGVRCAPREAWSSGTAPATASAAVLSEYQSRT